MSNDPLNNPDAFLPSNPDFCSGVIAVVGRTNVGKSSIVNALIEEKVSIVSATEQTTRQRIRGLYTDEDTQLVFVDTPGLHKSRHSMGTTMNKVARGATSDVDAVLLVLDGGVPPQPEDETWLRQLAKGEQTLIIALNKKDNAHYSDKAYRTMWTALCKEKERTKEAQWVYCSAREDTNIRKLRNALKELMPKGPYLFPPDIVSDFPRKLFIADVIREKYIPLLKEELPHCVAIWVDNIQEKENRWKIDATVYVDRNSQKGIVIGNKGRLLKRVQQAASQDLSEIYETHVDVKLFVTVEKGWRENFWMLKKFGVAE